MLPGPSLSDKLRQIGVVRTPAIEKALAGLPPRAFARTELAAFAHLDIPWPEGGAARFTLSPRITALLAELLEPAAGQRVLVLPHKPRLLVRLLEELDVAVDARVRARTYDRVLIVDGDWDAEDRARPHVADGGFMLRVRLDAHGENVVKYVRSGGQWVRMGLKGLRLAPERSLRPGFEAKGEPLENLLIIEGVQRRVWDGEEARREDTFFRRSVDVLWGPRPVVDRAQPRELAERLLLAKKLFHLAYVNQNVGDLANAEELYSASIETYPTAEAFTFRSWIHGLTGDFDGAIEGCKRAIEIDPEFGNPYNDIGAYLLEEGRPGEALGWLEKAKAAPRYEAPHYAFTNAGRARLMLGDQVAARNEFEAALRLSPGYEPARRMLDGLSPR